MKTSIQECVFLLALIVLIIAAFCIGIRKEIHRQNEQMITHQRNGYDVESD